MSDNRRFVIILGLFIIISLGLTVYSYTQVDLSLTLSRASVWQTVQKTLQHIGYFDRPLSTFIFFILVMLQFCLHQVSLKMCLKSELDLSAVWKIILVITPILLFSYPAYSYDLFNYMFTAKTVLLYRMNPYEIIPLQFTGFEPWLSFMHWTHATAAYPPLWVTMTLLPYLLGFGIFLLTLFNFKLLIIIFYLLTLWLISRKLEENETSKMTAYRLASLAFNPLVTIEVLVSAHNDIVMMALVIGAYYLYSSGKKPLSILILAVSVAVKNISLFLFPLYLWRWNLKTAVLLSVISLGFFVLILKRELLPWYFLWILPLAVMAGGQKLNLIISSVSLGLIFRYLPFLYFGNWNPPVPQLENIVSFIPVIFTLIYLYYRKLTFRAKKI